MSSVTIYDDQPRHRAGRRPVPRRVRPLRALGSAVLWLGAALGVASIAMVTYCALFQIRPEIVVSGSMEPTLPVGSLVFAAETAAPELRVGDVISVPRLRQNGLVTHRIVSTTAVEGGTSVILKGDANASSDPEPYLISSAGRVVLTLPVAGYIVDAMKTPMGIALIVAFASGAVILGFARQRSPDRSRTAPRMSSNRH